ncbi:MAG: formyltetrahydrofolate deformylase [Gammaproteobacteria bacterium]|jgi:formyltetrahydrofolate deformylase|uniref:formyltetrahydrofolate deformylase n=1 Tax=Thiomicrorhabdus cannonii TaxID=2748011 RepID=UPI0015BE5B7E|nr:formyltetrahydrofolate deformylase [Thiomicrorhabdus cannonii]MBD3755529.1 formyltetrahydrofolate deformylase [Gammaproteobacteria bacterium]
MSRVYRLVISCPDQVGIVAAVAQYIADKGATIVEANHHTDASNGWFFMRHEILASSLQEDLAEFEAGFAPIADKFQMEWFISDTAKPKKIALFASKESHCLADLLHRWHENELPGEIVCVIANHDDLRSMVEWYNVPFHHVPVTPDTKPKAFAQTEALVQQYGADLIVLARYMQILPPQMCADFAGRVINIHHSFLPSFVGARPYHQANERGVKLIGATCHYVTEVLDAGPIIEQDVIRVNHTHSIDDMKRLGRDVEKTVLARGLRYHLEDRVLIHGNKTVVFAS